MKTVGHHVAAILVNLGVRSRAEAMAMGKPADGEDDHVHLLVYFPPTVCISKLVNSLKGASSRVIRKKYAASLRKKLWGGALWSPSYFAGSCGGAPIEIVRQYIEQQKTPH